MFLFCIYNYFIKFYINRKINIITKFYKNENIIIGKDNIKTYVPFFKGYPKGTIIKNKFGYSKVQQNEENEKIYKILSNIIIKKSINIKEENIYKIILSCANSAYSVRKYLNGS